MADSVPTDHANADRHDRTARIEELLLAGLDYYFAGEHERARKFWMIQDKKILHGFPSQFHYITQVACEKECRKVRGICALDFSMPLKLCYNVFGAC